MLGSPWLASYADQESAQAVEVQAPAPASAAVHPAALHPVSEDRLSGVSLLASEAPAMGYDVSLHEEQSDASVVPPLVREYFLDSGPRLSRMVTRRITTRTTSTDTVSHSRSKCVVHPQSAIRTGFELAKVVVLSYDAVMTPWIVAWAPIWFGYKVISVVLLSFWFADMILNFFSGYYLNGEPVLQHKKIVLHYIRTWFVVDLAIIMADFVSVVVEFMELSEGGDFLALAPGLLRASRLFRVFKLIPAVSAMRMMRYKSLTSGLQFIGLGGKLVITLLWLNHVVCCMWFFIGLNGYSDTGFSWLDLQPPYQATSYRDGSLHLQYLTALHWSLTQMTPGSMQMPPQNSLEMSFNSCCVIVGLFAGAVLVSQLSAKIVKTNLETQEEATRLAKLQIYLREHQVSWGLRDRVRFQIQSRLTNHSRLTVKDVDLLGHLSQSLRKELNMECFGRHVMSHTLFHAWGFLEPALLEALCLHAVELLCLSRDDDLFTSHTVPEKMYLVLKGTLMYRLDGSDALKDGRELLKVHEGDWVSEAALWLECSYSGTLTSKTQCELLAVNVPKLLALLKKFPSVRGVNHHYCAAFHKVFTAVESRGDRDLRVSSEQLLMTMPKQWRLEVMLPLLHSSNALAGSLSLGFFSRTRTADVMDELRTELDSGKAILSLANGTVTRTVPLVTLYLKLESTDHVLVRLAKKGRDCDGFVAAATLPGAKIRQGEDAQQAVRRLIEIDLFLESTRLSMQGSVISSEECVSRKYGINSKYMKCTFYATTESGSDVGPAPTPPPPRPPSSMLSRGSSFLKVRGRGLEETPEQIALAGCRGFLFTNSDGEVALYAWMHEASFAVLKTARGQEALQSWVATNVGNCRVVKDSRKLDAVDPTDFPSDDGACHTPGSVSSI